MDDIWKEAEALDSTKKQLYEELGRTYVELEDIERRQKELRGKISQLKMGLSSVLPALETAVNELIKDAEVEDGDYTIDYKSKRIVANEPISDNSPG